MTENDDVLRRCRQCNRRQGLEQDYRTKRCMPGGRDVICRWCRRSNERAYYLKNLKALRAKSRRWQRNNKSVGKRWKKANGKKIRTTNRRLRKARPDRQRAYDAVARALRNGEIDREPCESCGRSPKKVNGRNRIHAHHGDYSRPLEITWLCSRCHGLRHRKENSDVSRRAAH